MNPLSRSCTRVVVALALPVLAGSENLTAAFELRDGVIQAFAFRASPWRRDVCRAATDVD